MTEELDLGKNPNCTPRPDEPRRRKLASIQKILSLEPIPEADRIELARFESVGWNVVVKKGEFEVGQLCVYFEIDSILPQEEWCDFLANPHKPSKPRRLKTKRMRQQVSQGLCMPLDSIPEIKLLKGIEGLEPREGNDCTTILSIQKWEPELTVSTSGEAEGGFPPLISKTDEDRVQAYPRLLEEFRGKMVYPSVKIDGTSGTFLNAGGETKVCSRNMSLKDIEGNLYWRIFYENGIDKIFDDNPNIGIQGEVCGPGIQKNKMGYDKVQLRVFNVYDVSNTRWFDPEEMVEFCLYNKLITVPMLTPFIFDFKDVDELVEFAKGEYPNGHPREGVVFRPAEGFFSQVLRGRASFKVINVDFNIKTNE